jgi:hypothetical protein
MVMIILTDSDCHECCLLGLDTVHYNRNPLKIRRKLLPHLLRQKILSNVNIQEHKKTKMCDSEWMVKRRWGTEQQRIWVREIIWRREIYFRKCNLEIGLAMISEQVSKYYTRSSFRYCGGDGQPNEAYNVGQFVQEYTASQARRQYACYKT